MWLAYLENGSTYQLHIVKDPRKCSYKFGAIFNINRIEINSASPSVQWRQASVSH